MFLACVVANSAYLSGTKEGPLCLHEALLWGLARMGTWRVLGWGAGPSYVFRAHCLSYGVCWGELEISHRTSGLFTIIVPKTIISIIQFLINACLPPGFCFLNSIYIFVVLKIEPRSSCILDKRSTLLPQTEDGYFRQGLIL